MPDRTLCLIVGAAKSGTTWLWRQLRRHPDVHFRSIKELHYFDALAKGRLTAEIARHEARRAEIARALERHPDEPPEPRLADIHDRTAWLTVLARGDDPAAYVAYLEDGADGRRVIGEATPAYALLDEDRLGQLMFLKRDVRIVFLMRDPVDRLWSHVRTIAKARARDGDFRGAADRVMKRVLNGTETEIVARSDYAGALDRLTRVVPKDRLCLGFHEEIGSGATLDRVTGFLGLTPLAPTEDRPNEGPPLAIMPAQKEAARAWLQPQYEAVQRFVHHVPDSWDRRVSS